MNNTKGILRDREIERFVRTYLNYDQINWEIFILCVCYVFRARVFLCSSLLGFLCWKVYTRVWSDGVYIYSLVSPRNIGIQGWRGEDRSFLKTA